LLNSAIKELIYTEANDLTKRFFGHRMIHSIVIIRLIAVGLKRIKTSHIILLYSVLADNCGKCGIA